MTGKNTSGSQAPADKTAADKASPDLAAVQAAVERALAAQSAAEAAARQAATDRQAAEAAALKATEALDAAIDAAKRAADAAESLGTDGAPMALATLVAEPAPPVALGMTAAEAVKRVKRTVTYSDKGATRTAEMPIREDEVLSVKDHGTHIVVVTTDGQKFTNADA